MSAYNEKDNLEKILASLPKPKLSLTADLIIKFRLYSYIILNRAKGWLTILPLKRHLLKNALAVILILALAASGTSLYAYANHDIMPGQTLYALKRGVENVEQSVSFTDNLKTQAYQKFSERRLEEALKLSEQTINVKESAPLTAKKSQDIQKNIEEAVSNIASAVETANKIANKNQAQIVKDKIIRRENLESRYLLRIESIASTTEDKKIVEKIGQARTAIKKYREILNSGRGEKNNKDKEKRNRENDRRSSQEQNNVREIDSAPSPIEKQNKKTK